MKRFPQILLILLLGLFACEKDDIELNGSTFIEVELKHPYAETATIIFEHENEVYEYEMEKQTDRMFRSPIVILQDTNYQFNIKLSLSMYPDTVVWVGKPAGIDATSVKINEFELTADYLVKTGATVSSNEYPSAVFSLIGRNNKIDVGKGEKWNPDIRIPAEVPQYKKYCRLTLPDEEFKTAQPRMQVLHTGNESDISKLEIDYLKLFAHISGVDTLLFEDTYDVDMPFNGYKHGGTYLRYPFFYDEENKHWAMPAEIKSGNLILIPEFHSDRIFHWWASERVEFPEETEYFVVESRVRITGAACVQIALDFWIDKTIPYVGSDVNNIEAGVSNFVFGEPTEEWQIIRFSTDSIIPWEE